MGRILDINTEEYGKRIIQFQKVNRNMKTAILFLALLGVALAIPFSQKAKMKRTYYQPKEIHGGFTPKIINGWEVEPHSRPYQVWLTVSSPEGDWLCGGSLLTENYVLTAGHCGDGADGAEVLLGAHNILEDENTTVTITTSKITVHEDFDINVVANDIAVFKLSSPAPINDVIKPATLPKRADLNNTYTGKVGTVSGWGLTDGFGSEISPVLRAVNSTIIENSECKSYFDIVIDSQVCISGKGGVGSCNGDSGGPLTVDGVQVGIVSYGVIFCQEGFPSAFTRITSFADWIEKHTDYVFK